MFICLLLLALGIASGLLALFFTSKPGVAEPAPGGISARGWVSLTLLALAGVVLVAQEARVLPALVARTAAGEPDAGVARTSATDSPNYKVVDLTNGLHASSGTAVPSPRNVEDERAEPKRHSPDYKVTDLTNGLRASSGTAGPSRNSVEDENAQLKQQVQVLKRQVQELESRLLALQAQATRNPGATATSVPPSNGFPVVMDLTNGFRRP
jgi:hypothetical protein